MKQNKTKKYGLKWQSCGAKISSWEVRGSACYFVDIRGADFFFTTPHSNTCIEDFVKFRICFAWSQYFKNR